MKTPATERVLAPGVAATLVVLVAWWSVPAQLPGWRVAATVMGWAGLALLTASLLFMVREPRLARALGGLENMYRWHHRTGVVGYTLVLAHPLAFAVDAWQAGPRYAWMALEPWSQSPQIQAGWLALFLLMLGLATTFAVHLRYRRWRAYHYALPAGVLLAFAHAYFMSAATPMVLALAVLAALALLARFLCSDLGASARPYRVAQVRRPAANMIEATLEPLAGALTVAPGQFVLAAFAEGPHYRGCGEYHPFTVSGTNEQGALQVTVKGLGWCSIHLQELEPGVFVRLQGPFGRFLHDMPAMPRLWVAGGIGITPFVAALRAQRTAQPTTLIYLYRTDADAAFLDELLDAARNDPLLTVIAQASADAAGDLALLLGRVDDLPARAIYACGPTPLVAALECELERRGVSSDSVRFESFDFR